MNRAWEDLVSSGALQVGVRLESLTSYKLGGPAAYFLEAQSRDDLAAMVPVEMPVLVVGRGSNLVVADEGFEGLVIRLGSAFGAITIVSEGTAVGGTAISGTAVGGTAVEGTVVAGAATPLPALARQASKAGRGGLEWMVGVPGSVGGAVRMNAGCFGSDTSQTLLSAEVLDVTTGVFTTRTPLDLEMSYRFTNLKSCELVLEATFSTQAASPEHSEAQMREITRWRKEHQPGGTFNAGSVFKNPPGDAAGRIIDDLGLKGTRVGEVSVSERHANFFVAEPGATARNVFDLVSTVRRRVFEETGIELVPEIQFAGFEESM